LVAELGSLPRSSNAMKRIVAKILFVACIVFARGSLAAQPNVWQPSPGHQQMPIWPGAAPDAQPAPGPEYATNIATAAGTKWVCIGNVTEPTMTVYSPRGTNTGVAVVVFPGGGYNVLAIDLEGTEVCDWLASRGITGVLLKYRVPHSGPHGLVEPKAPTALEDAQRTLGLLRFHAGRLHIDPRKIGVLGFSAGGHLVAATSSHFERRAYPAFDAADKESCRPDFAVALYPGHLWNNRRLDMNPHVPITSNAPPTFILQAENDPVDNINHSIAYYLALKNAEVPVEMHLYAEGGHAFGLRRTKYPITEWPQLVEKWLGTIGMLPGK
jgi:acetyl esterase/lipase